MKFIPHIKGWFSIKNQLIVSHMSRLKKKNYGHLNTWRKKLDKIQHLFMGGKNKKPQQTSNREELLQLDKEHLQKKPITNTILNGEKLKSFPTKIWNKAKMSPDTTAFQHQTRSSS